MRIEMFMQSTLKPVASPRKQMGSEYVVPKAFRSGGRLILPSLLDDIIDAAEEIKLRKSADDVERVLSRRFGLTRHEVSALLLSALCGYRRAYRSLRLTAMSGLQIAERLRVQTMEEVA